jgi:sarcosine oxidase
VRASDPVRHLHVLPAGGVRIESTNESWDCDVVLVLAGAGTGPLLQTVDHPEAAAVGPPAQRRHHHRFTFRLVSPGRRPRCWLDQSGDFAPDFTTYQHLVGPGRWAIGGSLSDADTAWELGPEETRERARQVVGAYVREQLDGNEPEVVEIVHCDAIGTGDGISTTQLGPVLALWGDNLFKHVPVLGELLARGGRDGRIPDVLLGLDPAAPRPQVSEPARPSGP